jgi:hypothetical protein
MSTMITRSKALSTPKTKSYPKPDTPSAPYMTRSKCLSVGVSPPRKLVLPTLPEKNEGSGFTWSKDDGPALWLGKDVGFVWRGDALWLGEKIGFMTKESFEAALQQQNEDNTLEEDSDEDMEPEDDRHLRPGYNPTSPYLGPSSPGFSPTSPNFKL